MNEKNVNRMSSDELILEIEGLRDELGRVVERLFEISKLLYAKAKNGDPNDQRCAAYTIYANAWIRFSGMVNQGIRRTSVVERTVRVARQRELDRVAEMQRKAAQQKRALQRVTRPSLESAPGMEDLVELYGHEVMGYAAR